MKFKLFTLLALFVSSISSAQWIDSLKVTESNGDCLVKVMGSNPTTSEKITKVVKEVTQNIVKVDIFIITGCPGYLAITPFDTTINLGSLSVEDYSISCRLLKDINLDNSNECYINNSISTLDSAIINHRVLESIAWQFAPVSAEWYYSEGLFVGFPISEDYIKFTSEKDTLINGMECRKIVKRHRAECNGRLSIEFVYNSGDTVFFYDSTFDKFQILYVANASEGDNWVIETKDEGEELDSIEVTVDSTSTTIINENSLRTLHVTYRKIDEFMPMEYSSIIVDRIGDIKYMFNWDNWSTIACDVNYSKGLRCYSDPVIGSYATGIADSCDQVVYWTGTEYDKANTKITISPNPANDFVQFTFAYNSLTAELYDLRGRLFMSEMVTSSDILSINHLEQGYYLMVLKNDNKVVAVEKLIKL